MKHLIIDANAWSSVFDKKNANYSDFSIIGELILKRRATLAWGGSKYCSELARCERFLNLHAELTRSGRANHLNDNEIDVLELRVQEREQTPDFDDPHIVALQIASKAIVIVSADKRAHRFFKSKHLYPSKHRIPKIYSSKRSIGALSHY